VNEYRLDLARRWAPPSGEREEREHRDVQKQLGMKEGFDVGLEMSGNAAAFRDMIDNMCHGGKIAMLGIPSEQIAIDWNKVIFNMLTINGIYGREMYETWYQMSVMLESGLNIKPGVITQVVLTLHHQCARSPARAAGGASGLCGRRGHTGGGRPAAGARRARADATPRRRSLSGLPLGHRDRLHGQQRAGVGAGAGAADCAKGGVGHTVPAGPV
jgi:threonine dehydrogenase-like Zn-dependent dehydrogenase